MRLLTCLAILLIVFGCAPIDTIKKNHSSGFAFYDSHGQIYDSATAGFQIRKEYQLENEPVIIVIATNSTNEINFIRQMQVIAKVNPEDYQYLYIIANSEEEDHSGYYTTKAVASNLLEGRRFKIMINGRCGKPLISDFQIIDEIDLRHRLQTALSETKGACGR